MTGEGEKVMMFTFGGRQVNSNNNTDNRQIAKILKSGFHN